MNDEAPTWDSTEPAQTAAPESAPSWDNTAPIEAQDANEVPSWDETTPKSDYETPGQMAITAVEGAAKGLAGPAATWAEKEILGVKPEDILARQQANPWTHGLAEAGGFTAGLLGGTGEAALLGRAGEAVAGAVGLGQAASTSAKLARGAVTAATEMGLLQTGDEASKWILNAPQTPGSVASNIGLAALLGGVTGGSLSGAKVAAAKVFNSTSLKEFVDTLAQRKAGIADGEMASFEGKSALQAIDAMKEGAGDSPSLYQKLDFPWKTKLTQTEMQKQLAASLTKATPAFEAFENEFGQQIEAGQPLRVSTSQQKSVMKNFISAMDTHLSNADRVYEDAGAENPWPAIGMGALRQSIEKPSMATKLADMWHEKFGADALGYTAAATVGGKLGSMVGHTLEGVYLGKEILGPTFSKFIKPLMERYPNIDLAGFQQALSVAKAVEKGESNLVNASKSVFGASKIFPEQVIPAAEDLEKLDDRSKEFGQGQGLQKMTHSTGKIGYYLPGHETAIAKTAGDAVQYLNAQRPQEQKTSPLDEPLPPSQAQEAQYKRTLQIAQQPLMVFKSIKEGTLTTDDLTTLRTIYPDYYQAMSQQLTTAMVNHIHEGGTIPYTTKQMASLFLGQPLDSSLTPFAIQSAQGVFAQQAAQNAAVAQAQMKPKANKGKLSKAADNYFTQNQAAAKRQKFGDA